eukprot:CFRG3987T1
MTSKHKKELPLEVIATMEYEWNLAHQYAKFKQCALSRQVLRSFLLNATENGIALHAHAQQKLCTFCGTLFVPEETCHVRIIGKQSFKRKCPVLQNKLNCTSTASSPQISPCETPDSSRKSSHYQSPTSFKTTDDKVDINENGYTSSRIGPPQIGMIRSRSFMHNPNTVAGKSKRRRHLIPNDMTNNYQHKHSYQSHKNVTDQGNSITATSTVIIHCSYCSRNSMFAGGPLRPKGVTQQHRKMNREGLPDKQARGNILPAESFISKDYAKKGQQNKLVSQRGDIVNIADKVDKQGKKPNTISNSMIIPNKSAKLSKSKNKKKLGLSAMLKKNVQNKNKETASGRLADFLSLL